MGNRPSSYMRPLALNFGLMALLPILLFAGLLLYHLLVTTIDDVRRQNRLLALSVEAQVELFLDLPKSHLSGVRSHLQDHALQGPSLDRMLDQHLQSSKLFESIYLIEGSGIVTGVGLPAEQEASRGNYLGLSLGHLEFYRRTMASGLDTWSGIFFSLISGKLSLALCLKVDEQKALVGNFVIENLVDYVRPRDDEINAETMIVDRGGAIIAHQRSEVVRQRVSLHHLPLVEAGLQGKSRTGTYFFNGEEFLATGVPIPSTGWVVLVAQPLRDVYGPVQRLAVGVTIGALLLVALALVVARRQAGRLVQPLRLLAEDSQRLAAGAGATPEFSPGYLEMAELSHSLRSMAEAIEEREQQLHRSREKYRGLVEQMADGLGAIDAENIFTYINPAMAEMLGYQPEDMIGRKVTDFHSPGEVARLQSQLEKRRDGGEDPYELQWLHRDGWRVTTLVSPRPIIEQGVYLGSTAVVRDITAQKAADLELMRLRNLLGNIIDSMPAVLIGVDADWRVNQWNRAAVDFVGTDRLHAVGRPLQEVFPLLTECLPLLQSAIADLGQMTLPHFSDQRHGEERRYEVTAYALKGETEPGAVIRIEDVTDQIRLQERVVQSEKMLSVGGLAAGMAHEVNNPLAGILQNLQLIEARLKGEGKSGRNALAEAGLDPAVLHQFLALSGVLERLTVVHESALRATAIVRNMLSFSRKGTGVRQSVDPAALLDSAIELAGQDYDQLHGFDFRRLQLVRDYAPELPPLECISGEIQQVLLNLLKNAAEALWQGETPDPKISISLRSSAGSLQIEIRDNGPGMGEEVRKRIFEPFFTTREGKGGTGLGLSISYFIITENHGGTMDVSSQPGQGTSFRISLPLEENADG